MNKRRVVITGMGVVTPIGIGLQEFWQGLMEGRNGVELITKFDTSKFDTKFAAEVKNFDPLNYLDKKAAKRMDEYTQFAIGSTTLAIEDSGLDLEKVDLERFGVVFGSGIGGIKTLRDQHFAYFESGTPKKNQSFLCYNDDRGYCCRANFN